MKRLTCFLIVCGTAFTAAAQDRATPTADAKSPGQQAVAAMIQRTTKQADEHLLLRRLLGNWDFSSLDGDKHPQTGHTKFRSIALGNFVVDEAVGTQLFIEEDFQFGGPQIALVSHGVYGFDPLKRQYTATWYTNFNTIAFQGTAEVKPGQRQLDFRLQHPLLTEMEKNPDQKKRIRYRITFVDETHLRLEFIEASDSDDTETRLFGVLATKR